MLINLQVYGDMERIKLMAILLVPLQERITPQPPVGMPFYEVGATLLLDTVGPHRREDSHMLQCAPSCSMIQKIFCTVSSLSRNTSRFELNAGKRGYFLHLCIISLQTHLYFF